jgi:glycosyltransferase involved in cell wall biosynthesis
MPNSLVSIIIPAFNEKDSLEELHMRIKEVFSKLDRPFEIIFIDDGSTDSTFETLNVLQSEHPNIVVIQHFKNIGKSLALMQGFNLAQGDMAITMDADLQDRPEEIPAFINKIDEGYDFVNGWRQNRQDKFFKRLVSTIFNGILHLIFKVEIKDVNCGFKAYRTSLFDWINLRGDLHRLIPVLIAHKGHKIAEIPVIHQKRKHGASKYKLFRYRGLLDIIAVAASTTTQIRPFHTFCEIGIFFWVLATLILGGWVVVYDHLVVSGNILMVMVGFWAILLGTFLPIFGFYLEIESSRFQGENWRKSLVKEIRDLRNT